MSIRASFVTGIVCCTLLLTVPRTTDAASAKAPVKAKAKSKAKAEAGAAPLTVKSFSASGLNNERELAALFRGDFDRISFKRE
jgi:hypothetical protein